MTPDVDEPWNLPPLPSRCGTSALEWAQQTSEQRKAEWVARPAWWHESVGAKIIEYWSKRPDVPKRAMRRRDAEYQWTLDPIDVRNAIMMLRNDNSIDRVAEVKGVSVGDLRRDLALLQAADVIHVAARISRRKP